MKRPPAATTEHGPVVHHAMPIVHPLTSQVASGSMPDCVIDPAIAEADEEADDDTPAGWATEQPLVVMLLRRPDRDPLYSIVLRRGTLETRR